MATTAQTFKLSRAAGFATIHRELDSDVARALAMWATRSDGRSFRELGGTAGFLLVELTFCKADLTYSAPDLKVFCDQKHLTPILQW